MSFTNRRDAYLIIGTRAVSVCGDFLAATTLELTLQQKGYGGAAISGLLIAASLPVALGGSVGGRLADRVSSRTLLMACGFAQALVCAVLAFVNQPVPIIVLVGLLACGLAITQPTLAALLPGAVPADRLPRFLGLSQTVSGVGMMIAPALAGFLVGQAGPRPALLLDAVSYMALVVAGLLLKVRNGGKNPATTPEETFARTRDGGDASESGTRPGGTHVPAGIGGAQGAPRIGAAEVSAAGRGWRVRDDRLLVVMLGTLGGVIAGVGAINVVEVFFVRETLHASATLFGVVAAAWTVGMLLGSVISSRLPRTRMTAMLLLAFNAVCCLAVLGASAVHGYAGWLIPIWLAGGLANGGINVVLNVLVSIRVPAASRGLAFGALASTAQGANLVGFFTAGLLVDHLAPRLLVAAAGTAGLLVCFAAAPIVRKTQRSSERRPEPPRTPVPSITARIPDSVEA